MVAQGTGYNTKVHKDDNGDTMVVESGGTLRVQSGGVVSRDVVKQISAMAGKAGATAGWAVPSAHAALTNSPVAGLPASQSGSTFVIPLQGLKVGDIITAFTVEAQIESAGGTATLDADLRAISNAAANPTDASLGAITQVSVTAQTKVQASKTLAAAETVAIDKTYYILLTGTTAASTDVQLQSIALSTTEQ